MLVPSPVYPTGADAPVDQRPTASPASVSVDDYARLISQAVNLGQIEEAIHLYRKQLAQSEQENGVDHPATAIVLLNYAVLLINEGQGQDAEQLLTRAYKINEPYRNGVGRGIFVPIYDLLLLGELNADRGQYKVAEDYYQRAMAAQKTLISKKPTSLTGTLNSYALLKDLLGDYKGALALFEQASSIEVTANDNHLPSPNTLINLANTFTDMGMHQRASELLAQAKAALDKSYGPNHPQQIGLDLQRCGNFMYLRAFRRAEPVCTDVLRRSRNQLGSRTYSTIYQMALFNMGALRRESGRYAEAIKFLQEGLSITEAHLGSNHPSLIEGLAGIGLANMRLGKFHLAKQHLERALLLAEKFLPPDHPTRALALFNIGTMYSRMKQYEAADSALRAALAILNARQDSGLLKKDEVIKLLSRLKVKPRLTPSNVPPADPSHHG